MDKMQHKPTTVKVRKAISQQKSIQAVLYN